MKHYRTFAKFFSCIETNNGTRAFRQTCWRLQHPAAVCEATEATTCSQWFGKWSSRRTRTSIRPRWLGQCCTFLQTDAHSKQRYATRHRIRRELQKKKFLTLPRKISKNTKTSRYDCQQKYLLHVFKPKLLSRIIL